MDATPKTQRRSPRAGSRCEPLLGYVGVLQRRKGWRGRGAGRQSAARVHVVVKRSTDGPIVRSLEDHGKDTVCAAAPAPAPAPVSSGFSVAAVSVPYLRRVNGIAAPLQHMCPCQRGQCWPSASANRHTTSPNHGSPCAAQREFREAYAAGPQGVPLMAPRATILRILRPGCGDGGTCQQQTSRITSVTTIKINGGMKTRIDMKCARTPSTKR